MAPTTRRSSPPSTRSWPSSGQAARQRLRSTPSAGDRRLDDLPVGEEARRLAPGADAAGRAGGDDVAGQQREDRRQVGHERRGVEDELARRRRLDDLAVDGAPDLLVGARCRARLVRRDEPRPERRRGLPRLALQELRRAVLPVAHRDVVEHRVAGDRRRRRVEVAVADRRADDHGELGLPVDRRRLRRQHDVVVGADQRRAVLGEDRREVGRLAAHLGDVVAVVQPDADDLVRRRHERRVVEVGDGERRPGRPWPRRPASPGSASSAPTSGRSSTVAASPSMRTARWAPSQADGGELHRALPSDS